MYFAGDTVYKFFRIIFAICAVAFIYQLIRCGMYDITADYIKGLIIWLIGAVSYGIMWIAREFY